MTTPRLDAFTEARAFASGAGCSEASCGCASHDPAHEGGRDGDGVRARSGIETFLAGCDEVIPILHLGARFLTEGDEDRIAHGDVILQDKAKLGQVVEFIFVNAAGDLVDVVVQAPQLALIAEQGFMLDGRDTL